MITDLIVLLIVSVATGEMVTRVLWFVGERVGDWWAGRRVWRDAVAERNEREGRTS